MLDNHGDILSARSEPKTGFMEDNWYKALTDGAVSLEICATLHK